MDCNFSNPVNASGSRPSAGEYWQFASATCQEIYITKIEDGQGNFYYVDARITYGDFFIAVFLILFLVAFAWKAVFDFIVPKSFKAHSKLDV
jgi:hypothetical protein